jgi:hypothetical protein
MNLSTRLLVFKILWNACAALVLFTWIFGEWFIWTVFKIRGGWAIFLYFALNFVVLAVCGIFKLKVGKLKQMNRLKNQSST